MENISLSIFEHFIELRRRIFYSTLNVIFLSIISYFFYDNIVNLLLKDFSQKLYTYNLTEGFVTKIKISFLSGIFLSIPMLIFQISLFIMPALKSNEKRIYFLLLLAGFFLFICGSFFSYKKILPLSITFLNQAEFFPKNVSPWLNYSGLLKFITQFLIGFGVAFQLPIVLIFIVNLKILSKQKLLNSFRYVIVICFIVAAVLTPPDWISQVMLAIPLIILYFSSILICYIFKIGN